MLGKIKPNFQQNLFQTKLKDLVNFEPSFEKLAQALDWSKIELLSSKTCSKTKKTFIAIRITKVLSMLKAAFKKSDASLVKH